MRLLSGASLSVRFVRCDVWVSVFLLRGIYLNESPFWGKSSCWVSVLSFDILVFLFGYVFLNESPFWGKSSCLGLDVWFQMLVLLFGFQSSC